MSLDQYLIAICGNTLCNPLNMESRAAQPVCRLVHSTLKFARVENDDIFEHFCQVKTQTHAR